MFCKVVFNVPLDRDFDYAIPPELETNIRPGLRVTAPLGPRSTTGLVTHVSAVCTAPAGVTLKNISSLVDEKPAFGSDLFPLARFIKEHWGGPIGQILFALVPPQTYFKASPAAGPIHLQPSNPPYALTRCQQQALQELRQVPPYQFRAFLLTGPAYSGKTETVLRRAGEVLCAYGQSLITVPDITAAHPLVAEARERFGPQNVYCWHSRMLLSEKKRYFAAVSSGRPCVVIGARSAVLLPFKNLRLAAMLDEANPHYKQEENKPYYHAREVLFFRAKQHGATLLLVSATPSVETYQHTLTGSVVRLETPEPIPGKTTPVPIKLTGKKGEQSKFLSNLLVQELSENLHRKEMSLLILNRQGYAQAYACLNCGTYAKCKKCGSLLAREKSGDGPDRLVCKNCGAREALEQECPRCHNVIFKSRGGGTQKITTELAKLFPQAKLLRLEGDTLKTKSGQGFEALQALRHGSADIIVGTRVAAGALRGAKITLAAVLDAELELSSPDFRSGENFARLLFDLRGHLSALKGGRLLVQTADKDAYDYAPLLSGSYRFALEHELALREAFAYPPFVRLFKLTLKAKQADLLDEQIQRLRGLCKPLALEILGPVWASKKTDTLKKQYLLFKTDDARRADLLGTLERFDPGRQVSLHLSADPYDFY